MKRKSKKKTRLFLLGLISGFLLWFILDLAFDWDDHVRDFWQGFSDGKQKLESTE